LSVTTVVNIFVGMFETRKRFTFHWQVYEI